MKMTTEDLINESHQRTLEYQTRMFQEAELHRREYQKLLMETTKLEIEGKYMTKEIECLRRLLKALKTHDDELYDQTIREMEDENIARP